MLLNSVVLTAFLGSLAGAAPAQGPAVTCCDALSLILQEKVVQLGNKTTENEYKNTRYTYWTERSSEVTPSCFVKPSSSEDVSATLKILSQPQYRNVLSCKFAIRSGGHTPWPAAAINGGVTIDLSNMRKLEVAEDRKSIGVGAGNKWGMVYSKLEQMDLAVSGGRWGNVGVGGLLTGGGLSFFQGKRGLACDGILNHEVVLSNGTIVQANPKVNTDLYKALKGGNNNFGIVTRFDLEAFQQGKIWGGGILHAAKDPTTLSWFTNFANSSLTDLDSMVMYSTVPLFGQWMSGGLVTYAKNVTDPSSFRDFYNTSLFSTASITTYNQIAQFNAIGTPFGGRAVWATFSFKNNAAFMRTVIDLAAQESRTMPLFSPGIQLIFQPLWKAPRAKVLAETGGNSLGLDDQGDLIIVLCSSGSRRAADDMTINLAMKGFINKATQKARDAGVYSSYIYLNYAAEFQDPIAGYGESNRAQLIAVSEKYDPIQLFQKQVPGGFKLRRAEGDWV
ncbi:FAD-binding domain-containing protein [Tothia fuscella]|uniref:FAD-binding domain-containing protein n=1 Tax=Tothia fuscella TaxID=1048955 RepID=A0A9P4NSM3_9PEZI|nr:FAD-binding domain-containing protein [Tothia fuscella]